MKLDQHSARFVGDLQCLRNIDPLALLYSTNEPHSGIEKNLARKTGLIRLNLLVIEAQRTRRKHLRIQIVLEIWLGYAAFQIKETHQDSIGHLVQLWQNSRQDNQEIETKSGYLPRGY